MDTVVTVLEAFVDQENLHNLEGPRGVANLTKIVEVLGYKNPSSVNLMGFTTGKDALIRFLEDNPGAQEAIYTWISEQTTLEWRYALAAALTTPIKT
jgi:hypothetical protein